MLKKFHDYFKSVYGSRWENLYRHLLMKEKQIARKNKFSHFDWDSFTKEILQQDQMEVLYSEQIDSVADREVKNHRDYFWFTESFQKFYKEIPRDDQGLLAYYVMDPASFIAADFLPIHPNDRVLDMCAAPGGKTLILAEKIYLQGELIANELSQARRERLIKVIQNYISKSSRSRIWVKGLDGNQYGLKMPNTFDKILLDAPCSGERHLLQSEKDFSEWSVSRVERLAHRQYSLLAAAYLALKDGGQLLYSTCSLNPLENDEVVKKLLKKKPNIKCVSGDYNLVVHSFSDFQPEQTECGYMFLPDKFGFGPIYFSLLKK